MIRIVPVDEENCGRYSAYVAAHPQARFGHDLDWARTLRDTYGVTIDHFLAAEGDRVVGVCPLFLCKPIFGGVHYQTSLFPSFFGPLYDSPQALDAILDAIVQKASTAQYAEILSPTPLPPDKRLPHLDQPDYTFRLSLDAAPDQVYGNFRRNYKRILRDPKLHEEVELVVDDDGRLAREFHRLYAHLYARKHGFIPHIESLFHNIYKHYRNREARIYMAKHRGQFIGGIFTFWKYGEIYCGWSGQDQRTEYYPMHFLIWKIMQDGIAQGCHWFNHGEAPRDNENLKLFKQGWAMQASDTYRYFVAGRLSQPNVRLYDRYSWTKKLISLLPAQVTSGILSPLIRYIL